MKVVLVAESGADIPKDIAEKEGIYIVPMHVTFDGETRMMELSQHLTSLIILKRI